MIPVYELRLVRARRALRIAESQANCAAQAALALHSLIGASDREHMACLFVNGRNAIVGANVVAIGGQTTDVRSVFRAAVLGQAHALVLGHNHPSGDPYPSTEDIEVTRRLGDAGKLLAIPILDHIIVTPTRARWCSLRDSGLLPDPALRKEVRST